jgi:prepilin-type N-terminal cleavage/methylation domain-containing protein
MRIQIPISETSRGFTLMELAVVMALLGLTISHLLSTARSQSDRMAVLGAREELVGLLHRARTEAISRGGAEVVLSSSPPSAELLSREETLARTSIGESYGVTLGLSRGRAEVRLSFGPLGLGLVSSQTLQITKGEAEAFLVVSSLGRVTRP